MPRNALTDLSAVAATTAMRRGEIRSEDYARALLDRARELERLNAFRTLDPNGVLEAARAADKERLAGSDLGVLHGLPIPVKDSVNTRALPTSNGTRALRDFQPREDAAALSPLFAQGAILMGKTNIHEMSRGWTSNNAHFGPVRNPYAPDRIPGGSSGGSAVAVATRMAPLAIAEDTLGSIRVPSTLCGIAGLRPTYGRYPGTGIMSLTLDKFDQVGPLARTVADLTLFDSVVTGESTPLAATDLRGVRIGVSPALLTDTDPEVERIVTMVLDKLRSAGAVIVQAELPDIAHHALPIATTLIGYENVTSISSFLDEYRTGISFAELIAQASPGMQEAYSFPPIPQAAYEAALREREQLRTELRDYYAGNAIAALAFPPVLVPAPPISDDLSFEIRGKTVSIRTVMGRNTSLGSVASLCSLVLPGGLTNAGLPVGIEFAGLPGNDRALLSLGMSIEKALGQISAPAI